MTAITNLPDLRPSLLLDFANSGRVDPRIQCTRASSATCFGPNGKLRTVAANVPRIDYDPVTGKCLGLLVEEQRTNLWLNSATAVAQSFAVTTQAYTLSFEGSGSIALTGAYSGNSSAGTLQSGRRTLTFTASSGALSCTPSGDVRNVQLEAGAFPTSYIPTAASAVTRATDTVYMSGINLSSWYRGDEGAFVIENEVANLAASGVTVMPRFSDAGSSNYSLSMRYGQVISGVDFVVLNNGTQVDSDSFPVTVNTPMKIAAAYKADDFAFVKDGGAVLTYVSGTVPAITQLNLSIGQSGFIRRFVYYPKRITNAQLQRLTA